MWKEINLNHALLLEKVFPQAISQSTNAVPDIYKQATIYRTAGCELATDLKVGERVKLIGDKEQGIYPVLEERDGAFRTDCKPASDKVFVYGREVNDFMRGGLRTAIAMLNISAATQETRPQSARAAKSNSTRSGGR